MEVSGSNPDKTRFIWHSRGHENCACICFNPGLENGVVVNLEFFYFQQTPQLYGYQDLLINVKKTKRSKPDNLIMRFDHRASAAERGHHQHHLRRDGS